MKVAKLPNGTELQFDSKLSDSAVEAAVRAHMGVRDDGPSDDAIDIEELLMEFVSVAKSLRTSIVAMTKAQSDTTDKIEKLARSNNEVVKAVGSVAEAIGENLGAHGGHVRDLAQSVAKAQKDASGNLESLGKKLYELGRTVSEDKGEMKALAAGFAALGAKVDAAAGDVVDALRAPKKIRHDKEGRPVGLDIG